MKEIIGLDGQIDTLPDGSKVLTKAAIKGSNISILGT